MSRHYPEEGYYAYQTLEESAGGFKGDLKRRALERSSRIGKLLRRAALVHGNEVWELAAAFPAGSKVLDIGCGSGDYLAIFQKFGLACFGLERSPKAIALARQRGFQVAQKWEDFSEEKFDLILLRHTLEHLPDPKETLARCRHLIQSNGRLAVTVPSFSSLSFRLFGAAYWQIDAPRHLFCYPIKALKNLVTASGWVVEKSWTTSLPSGLAYSIEHRLARRFPKRKPFYPGRGPEKRWHKGLRLLLALPLFLFDRLGLGENISLILKADDR